MECQFKGGVGKVRSLPPIGMRIIKSAIAVAISAVFMEYVVRDTPFFACIGAVVSMERTMEKSFEAALMRNLGTFIGGVFGMLVSFLTENVAIQALGVIPVIYIINLLKKHPSIIPGCIVFFAVVYLNDANTGWIYGLRRITETFMGSIIGLGVNNLIKSPREDMEI
ncbi:FUSC family protein [Andreesenia angusta]|uniref:FUSC family protein n=1 Tax=Andreesenia angusta TaxID=39480 RepID=UPI0008D96FE4|nr:aromatic acid exporter family protein [Andreesenia angusta]